MDVAALEKEPRKNFRMRNVTLAIVVILSVAIFLFVLFQHPSFPNITLPGFSQKKYAQEELVNYALSLINTDRQAFGLQNVTLSDSSSGQQHADNMLNQKFYSHWDLNGYKPYMRYTLAGGQGSVTENVGWTYTFGFIDAKEAMEDLQWEMVYDDAHADWGHRDNILDPFHNKVSLGVAYNDHNLYFVQDFENDYVEWEKRTIINNEVTMKGTILKEGISIEQVAIYYDNPTPLTAEQVMKPPYDFSYDLGIFVGMALPSGWEAAWGITITAQEWTQTEQNFEIQFNLSEAFTTHGEGVYTLCLQTEDDFLTTYSVWHEG